MASQYERAREDYELLQWCWENGHSDFLDRAKKLTDYARNKQWSDDVARVMNARGVPTLTIPKFFATLNAISGKQLASRSDVRFAPLKDATQQEALVMDKVYLHVAQRNRLDFIESTVFDRGALLGRGFYDVRIDYDDSYQGHVKIRAPRPQQIVLEPGMEGYDPAEWAQVFEVPWMTRLDIEFIYGKHVADELKNRPYADFLTYEDRTRADLLGSYNARDFPRNHEGEKYVRAYRLVSRQFKVNKVKECFVDTETGDFSEIPETWDREKIRRLLETVPFITTDKRRVQTIRWRVTADDLVLHDEDSPYEKFTIVPYFPYFIDNEPAGHMEYLTDMQDLTNKSMSKQLEILSTTANSGYKIKKGSLKNMTIQEVEMRGAQSGIVFELDEVNDLEKLQPNQVPSGFDRFTQIVDTMYDKASGISNQTRGFAREDVAAKAIIQNEAANDINFAKMFEHLFYSKSLLAERIHDCVQSTYTETRLITVTGGVTAQNIEQITINQPTPEGQVLNDVTRGTYSLTVIPSKARTTLEETEFDMLISLRRDLGIQIPDKVILEASPLPNKAEVIQGLVKDSNDAQAAREAMEAEQHQLQQQIAAAEVRLKNANANLAESRAIKASAEAREGGALDQQRIDNERARDEASNEIARLKLRADQLAQRREEAMELTRMGHERRMAQIAGPDQKGKDNGKAKR